GFMLAKVAAEVERDAGSGPEFVRIRQGGRPVESTSFDSIDLALALAGITLRHRPEASDPPWTLTMPAPREPGDRMPLRELTFVAQTADPPRPVRDLLHPYLRSRVLVPIACLAARRTTL